MRRCYYVANDDQEQRFESYSAALDFLSRATSPRWRYLDAGQWRVKNASVGSESRARKSRICLLLRRMKMPDHDAFGLRMGTSVSKLRAWLRAQLEPLWVN